MTPDSARNLITGGLLVRTGLAALIAAAGLAGCASTASQSTNAEDADASTLPPPDETVVEAPVQETREIDPAALATFDALLLEAPINPAARNIAYETNPPQTEEETSEPTTGAVSVYGDVPGAGNDGLVSASNPGGFESLSQVTFASEGSDFDPEISADGSMLVFASTQHAPTADIYLTEVGASTITQITSDVSNDVMPSISPDSQRVAFASDRNGSWDIFVTTVEGGQPVQITSDATHELHPSWSPDGREMVFSRLGQTSGRWELWVLDVAQPARRRFIGYGLFPVWSPTGDKIAFQRSRGRGDRLFSVWTIDYVGGEGVRPTEIFSAEGQAAVNPSWSPDGTRLSFSLIPAGNAEQGKRPPVADLYICRVDGADRATLTNGQHSNLSPTWGGDGRIYFVSDRSGSDNIWSLTPRHAIRAATIGQPAGGTGLADVDQNDD
jgi:TolB protein